MPNDLPAFFPESLDICYFVNSGSEAVEGALKLAKRFTGRSKIIYFTERISWKHPRCTEQFREAKYTGMHSDHCMPDTWQIDFNDFQSLDVIDNHTACVIVEPVQAEAGVIYPVKGFLEDIRERCTEYGLPSDIR